jgi:hypothetical protein
MSSRRYSAPRRGQFELELLVFVALVITTYVVTGRRDMCWLGFFELNLLSIPLSRPHFEWSECRKGLLPLLITTVIALPITIWVSLERPHPNFWLGCFLDLIMLLVVCLHLRTAFLLGRSMGAKEGGQ